MEGKIMARKKYTISESDYLVAKTYIERKFGTDLEWFLSFLPPGDISQCKATFFSDITNPDSLNGWCETYLGSKQWEQLKTAVRIARKRKRDSHNSDKKPKHIALSRQAWVILRNLSQKEGITISEIIIKYLEDK